MAPARKFTFICGQDDYLVGRMGKERFEALSAGVDDEFGKEVINGFAANMGEVESALARFREAVQTVSMFGGRRVVWLRDVNFLADSVTGRAEGTLALLEGLKEVLEGLSTEDTAVLITASPVDRRRTFPKWCEQNADFAVAGGDADSSGEALAGVAMAEAKSLGLSFAPGAIDLLLTRVGANTRLLVEEVRKLAAYCGEKTRIEENDVEEIIPNSAEGDFFETAEAFFAGDLRWTLAALHRHFFSGGDARPVLAALQNRNRILLQVRALVDSGEVKISPRGVDGLARAAGGYAERFGEAAKEKSAYTVFTQNPWYLGKLAGGKLPSLKRLIDNQQEFIVAFEEIVRRSDEQEEVLRDMTVRCLAA